MFSCFFISRKYLAYNKTYTMYTVDIVYAFYYNGGTKGDD